MEFANEWATTIATLGLIGVTVWYAFQTQGLAKSARDSAESSRQAAEYSARSAAVAAAGTIVDFYVGPTFAISSEHEDFPFQGVRMECSGAAVYVHHVLVEDAWALDPECTNDASSYGSVEIFREGEIPELSGLEERPTLMHTDEFAFLEFPPEKWLKVDVAALTVAIDYSFDGKQPLRCRRIEWNVYDVADTGR